MLFTVHVFYISRSYCSPKYKDMGKSWLFKLCLCLTKPCTFSLQSQEAHSCSFLSITWPYWPKRYFCPSVCPAIHPSVFVLFPDIYSTTIKLNNFELETKQLLGESPNPFSIFRRPSWISRLLRPI